MSPEQARGQSVDKRTDIWAFGCVLYEMLTGRLAFPGDTVSDTIAKILEREPDWSALPAATPAAHSTAAAPLPREGSEAAPERHRRRQDRDRRDRRCAAGTSDETTALRLAAKTRTTWLPWVALAALAAGVAVWEARRPPIIQENPLANAQFSRFTDWEGTEAGAEISPDGKFVAFIADRDGRVRPVGEPGGHRAFSQPHPGHPAAERSLDILRTFGFSGDGAEIWFTDGGRLRARQSGSSL